MKVPTVGVHDNFFDLGGTSLAAALLLFTAAGVFNRSVSIRESIQRPTVAMLADALVPV